MFVGSFTIFFLRTNVRHQLKIVLLQWFFFYLRHIYVDKKIEENDAEKKTKEKD